MKALILAALTLASSAFAQQAQETYVIINGQTYKLPPGQGVYVAPRARSDGYDPYQGLTRSRSAVEEQESSTERPHYSQGINPRTGAVYPSAGEAAVNPANGDVYPRVPGGYVNPRTGEFFPGQ